MSLQLPPNRKFETHVTLSGFCDDVLRQAEKWGAGHGFKWTHILLAGGVSASQPMFTFRVAGSLEQQLERARSIGDAMRLIDLEVVRVKVECEAHDVARFFDDSGSVAEHSGYFEHHVKLKLDNATELETLAQLVSSHDARLSSNARRQLSDGVVERFVTQRAYKSTSWEAMNRLTALIAVLEANAYCILETEDEYVLYDSNLHLDAGWL